jgi:hypothetical protein
MITAPAAPFAAVGHGQGAVNAFDAGGFRLRIGFMAAMVSLAALSAFVSDRHPNKNNQANEQNRANEEQ